MNKGILSVNGNKAMNYLLQTLFKQEFHFVPVADVYQAMHHLRTKKEFSALVVDLDFHPQQSWDLIQHIKSSKLYTLPVLVLTTENNDTLKKKCYELGVDEIFFKPFNPLDLIAAIKSTVDTKVLNH